MRDVDRCQNHVLAGSPGEATLTASRFYRREETCLEFVGDQLSAVLSATYEHALSQSVMSFLHPNSYR